jgi:hypothetical protein
LAGLRQFPPVPPYVKYVTTPRPRRRYWWAGKSQVNGQSTASQQQASSEGRTDEDATNGVLVVQVRHLGTIFRDVFQLAGREAFVTAPE